MVYRVHREIIKTDLAARYYPKKLAEDHPDITLEVYRKSMGEISTIIINLTEEAIDDFPA